MIIVAATVLGCVPLPAAMMPLQGPSADPTGSTSARAYGTLPVAIGLFLAEPPTLYAGGGLRLSHQFTPLLSVGVEGTCVNGLASAGSELVFAERAHARFSMLDDHLSLTAGLGAQAQGVARGQQLDTAVTGDVALSFGWRLEGVEPYASAGLSLSGPLWKSPPPSEGYFFAAVGFAFRPAPGWRVDAELDSFPINFRLSPQPDQAEQSPVVMPTVSAAYVFGEDSP